MEKRFPTYLRVLAIVVLSTIFIMSFSQLGVKAYEKFLQQDQKFAANTFIGTVQVSGESTKQANENLIYTIAEWQSKSRLSLTFADRKMTIPMDFIHFSLEESVQDAENGMDNPLFATITETNIRQLLKEIVDEQVIERVKVDQLQAEIQRQAGLLDVNERVISLTKFFEESVSVSVISHAKKQHIDVKSLSSWVESTHPITIPAFGEFSFINDLSVNAGSWTDEFLTQVASLVYEASLSTNLQILERNTSQEVPVGVTAGYEAKVNRNGMDLKLANPNDFEMTVTIKATQPGVLIVEISGYETEQQYKVVLKDSKTIPYRKIIQYTALLPNGSETIKKSGKLGYSVSVYRETYNSLNEKLDSVQISNDFYLPVNEVVLKEIPVESEVIGGDDMELELIEEGEDDHSDEELDTQLRVDEELGEDSIEEKLPLDTKEKDKSID
ncbi:VanW family protein [Peribacillus sp. JNUCC 23]